MGDGHDEGFEVPGEIASIKLLADYVDRCAEACSLDGERAYALHLAIDELATNVVVHAYEEQGLSGVIGVYRWREGDLLYLSLEDTGPPYDPTQRPDPDLESPVEEREIGGLGIYLVKQSVDVFRYERVGDRNRVTVGVRTG